MLTEADYGNLQTACLTSTMRQDERWRAVLDELARKLEQLRDAPAEPQEGR